MAKVLEWFLVLSKFLRIFIVEYCSGGDLRQRMSLKKKSNEYFLYKKCRDWMVQLTSGLGNGFDGSLSRFLLNPISNH